MAIISLHGKIGAGKDISGQIFQYLTSDYYPHKSFKRFIDKYNSEWGPPQNQWEIKKFADKLKGTICLWLGCTREQLEDREFKEKELGPEWWYYKFENILISYINNNYPENQKQELEQYLIKLSPRKLLQILGTEAGRDIIHPDVWVNLLFSDYKPYNEVETLASASGFKLQTEEIYPNWIITDNRFPNEIIRVKNEGGITIKIVRPIHLRFPEAWKNFDQASDKSYTRTEENFMEFLKISNWEPYRKLYASLTHYSEIALDNYDNFKYTIINDGTLEELIEKLKEILINEKII